MAALRAEQGTPNIVLIGLPHVESLRKTEAKLCFWNIPHYAWHEPDLDLLDDFTAIATAPLSGEQRDVMKNYRVYAPVAQLVEQRPLKALVVGSSPTRSTNGAGTDV